MKNASCFFALSLPWGNDMDSYLIRQAEHFCNSRGTDDAPQ